MTPTLKNLFKLLQTMVDYKNKLCNQINIKTIIYSLVLIITIMVLPSKILQTLLIMVSIMVLIYAIRNNDSIPKFKPNNQYPRRIIE